MHLRWVPSLQPRSQIKDAQFRGSLVRTVLIVLMLISLIPVLLVGALNYFRSRSLLREQVNTQMENLVAHEIETIRLAVSENDVVLDRLVTDAAFNDNLYTLLHTEAGSYENNQARAYLFFSLRENPRTAILNVFDRVFIVLPDGSVLLATDEQWMKAGLGLETVKSQDILSLSGANKTTLIFNRLYGYHNKMALLSARSFVDEQEQVMATLIAVTSSDVPHRVLADAESFLNGANSYFFTETGQLVGPWEPKILVALPENPPITKALEPLLGGKALLSAAFAATTYQDEPVLGYGEWMPEYNIGVVITVAEQSIYAVNNPLDPFTLLLLFASLALGAGLVFLGSTRLVNPLVELAQAAENFSRGNWDQRANIQRDDELGLLAFSFNNMADQLSELYHSLETVVEKRTSQLRIASEVGQLATSTTHIGDTLSRMVALITERFGFYNVSVYLMEQTGQALRLREAGGVASEQLIEQGERVVRDESTLVGWVALHNEPRVIAGTDDPLFTANSLLPDTQSQAAVPIAVGDEVLGVLSIQSAQAASFDDETLSVFTTLANQVSSSLQNARLLENTQVSYQETSQLYRTTRTVIQAHSEAEIIQSMVDAFSHLPYLGAILTTEGEHFKILAITDPKTGRVEKSLQSLNIPMGEIGDLLIENRVVLVEDITQPSPYENILAFLLRRGVRSAALLAVTESGRLSKVLALGSREAGQVTLTGIQPYASLAEVIGSSLEKFHVLSALQQRLTELQILASVAQAVTAETNLNSLYRVLHEQVIQTLGSDLEFAVANYNEATNQIAFPYFFEKDQQISIAPFQLGEGLTSTLIQSRKPLLLPDETSIRARSAKLVGRPARSWMGVPLIFGGEVLGALIVQDLENENRFTQDDLNLFMALAPQIATALRNTQLYTQSQEALHAYDQERFLLNTLLDAMPEGISFKDPQGRYIRASSSVAQMYDLNPADLVGKTDADLVNAETAEAIAAQEQLVIVNGTPEIGLIEKVTTPSGRQAWSHTSRIPIYNADGSLYGLLIIQRDVTELKEAEALAQRRAGQVLTAAEIARDTTGTLDVKTLLQKAVNLVRERFGFYHASIFLVDALNEYAVLRESTGIAGERMIQAGHRLAVGSRSIVGTVTDTGQPLIVNDVKVDPTHLPNPLLPETRSELAIPIIRADQILGALDVQSTEVNAFSEEDVNVLGILADQLAVAIVNGDLFAKTQELLTKHRLLRQITLAASSTINVEEALVNIVSGLRTAQMGERIAILMVNSEGMLQVQASAGYEGTRLSELRIAMGQGITGLAAEEKRPVRIDDTLNESRYINVDPGVRSELAVPILFGEELLGVLNLESTQVMAFDENDQEIMGALGNSLGGIIANVRLVTQVRQQVIRERQLFDVTSKIRHSVDLANILQTSAKEIAQAVGARRARIEITAGQGLAEPGGSTGSGTHGHGNGNGRHHGQEDKA